MQTICHNDNLHWQSKSFHHDNLYCAVTMTTYTILLPGYHDNLCSIVTMPTWSSMLTGTTATVRWCYHANKHVAITKTGTIFCYYNNFLQAYLSFWLPSCAVAGCSLILVLWDLRDTPTGRDLLRGVCVASTVNPLSSSSSPVNLWEWIYFEYRWTRSLGWARSHFRKTTRSHIHLTKYSKWPCTQWPCTWVFIPILTLIEYYRSGPYRQYNDISVLPDLSHINNICTGSRTIKCLMFSSLYIFNLKWLIINTRQSS